MIPLNLIGLLLVIIFAKTYNKDFFLAIFLLFMVLSYSFLYTLIILKKKVVYRQIII